MGQTDSSVGCRECDDIWDRVITVWGAGSDDIWDRMREVIAVWGCRECDGDMGQSERSDSIVGCRECDGI